MKTSFLTLFAMFGMTSGFSVAPQRTSIASRPMRTSMTNIASSTIGTNDSKSSSDESSVEADNASPEALEMKEVRMELVQRYVSAGKSEEFAEQEVDKFLSDPERSEKFLEMRRYSKAQAEELLGFESILFVGGGFFLGLMGTVGFKYLSAYQELNM